MTDNISDMLKKLYQQALLDSARRSPVFSRFGEGYLVPGTSGGLREYTEDDRQQWYRNRVRLLRLRVKHDGHRKPSKGKPLRLIPEVEEY